MSISKHGRPVRENRGILLARFRDAMPEGPTPLPDDDDPTFFEVRSTGPSCESSQEEGRTSPPSLFRTPANMFGINREYIGQLPLSDPEGELLPRDFLQVDRYTSDDVQRLNDPDNEPPSQLLADPLPSNAGMTGPRIHLFLTSRSNVLIMRHTPIRVSSIWTPGTVDSHRSRWTIFGVSRRFSQAQNSIRGT